jgi:3-dehydroquinate synthase
VIIVPEGEEAKSFKSYETVLNKLAELKANRSSAVIALGGGVVGDLSGYVASTFMRGVDLVQIPTTLLAQVDSSIGGKNGINLESGKNLVGTITQANLIIADAQCLSTLPESDYLSGLGEVVKYALLGNLTVWEILENNPEKTLARDGDTLAEIIRSCMNHKIHIVSRDPFERNGMRATLNLGHTLAHVIEKATNYKIAHGEAVAVGLRYICELSLILELINKDQCAKYLQLIDSLNLGRNIPQQVLDVGAEQLVTWMLGDKKSSGDSLNFVLFQSEGGAKLVNDVDPSTITKVLVNFLNSN